MYVVPENLPVAAHHLLLLHFSLMTSGSFFLVFEAISKLSNSFARINNIVGTQRLISYSQTFMKHYLSNSFVKTSYFFGKNCI